MIYLDNAATTALDPRVSAAMLEVMQQHYGNPSSIHAAGRKARALVEQARKTVARLINAAPAEVFFTSGGTEADNTALINGVVQLGVKHLITSSIEHHAVTHTAEYLAKQYGVRLSWVNHQPNGRVDLEDLERLLQMEGKAMVSLMHANNEVGILLPIMQVGELCKKYDALFHSDTVQSMGHYPMDVKAAGLDCTACAAHKFHGPKGVGFMYINSERNFGPFIHGGAQERNMRGGTENVYGIVGLARALELAYEELEADRAHILSLKRQLRDGLLERIPGVQFNGGSDDLENSLFTVLNVHFPANDGSEMFLFNLDIAGICASGGSACSSGSNQGSHVLRGLGVNQEQPNVRFSFSKFNTAEEIQLAIKKVSALFA
jgi:cysteine desulfurase